MHAKRHYTSWDNLCIIVDQAMRTLTGRVKMKGEPYPANETEERGLTEVQRKYSAALMRINHAGEICAQALYHGQEAVSSSEKVQEKMRQAALEEGDHLHWCQERLQELGSHVSYLNPLWYVGSFCIGMAAGMIGDTWSLGFVVETERQVIKHLEGHMALLPLQDARSYKILQQMENDEAKHRDEAINLGARELPEAIKKAMAFTSRIMVKTAYWI